MTRLALRVLMKAFLLFAACMLVWRFLAFFYPVRGQMMYPGIRDGDLLLLTRTHGPFHMGDVVLARAGDETILARIEAQEGDVVELDESGQLWVNDSVWSEDVFYPTFAAQDGISFPYTVEEDRLFLLCDHRTDTRDSRSFGTVREENVMGRVIAVMRRRGI